MVWGIRQDLFTFSKNELVGNERDFNPSQSYCRGTWYAD